MWVVGMVGWMDIPQSMDMPYGYIYIYIYIKIYYLIVYNTTVTVSWPIPGSIVRLPGIIIIDLRDDFCSKFTQCMLPGNVGFCSHD